MALPQSYMERPVNMFLDRRNDGSLKEQADHAAQHGVPLDVGRDRMLALSHLNGPHWVSHFVAKDHHPFTLGVRDPPQTSACESGANRPPNSVTRYT